MIAGHATVKFSLLAPWDDPRGGQVQRVRLDNGIIALEVLSLGAIIRSLWTADRHGDRGNIVLATDSVAEYLAQQAILGAVSGRYSNRIANAKLQWQGQQFQLDRNFRGHCLHGGHLGFHHRQWQLGQLPDGVRLTLFSASGDMGFPGNCQVQLDYRLVGANLYVEFLAACDAPCPVSLTQHSYFNLDGSADIRQHRLSIQAEQVLRADVDGIPQRMAATKGSVFDLQQGDILANRLTHPELQPTHGYDHCYVCQPEGDNLQPLATLSAASSGRQLTLFSNQPGLQCYTGNYLAGTPGRKGQQLQAYQGLCLEPQMLPDSPNQSWLPGQPWLLPGQQYHHLSRYLFEAH